MRPAKADPPAPRKSGWRSTRHNTGDADERHPVRRNCHTMHPGEAQRSDRAWHVVARARARAHANNMHVYK